MTPNQQKQTEDAKDLPTRGLHSVAVDDWAELAAPRNTPMHSAAMDAARVGRGTRVLDVGCGTGEALQLASLRGADLTGIDIAIPFIELAKRRLPQADLRVGDMHELPFKDGSFDAVLHTNTLMFSPEKPRAVREARRVLASGGRMAIAGWAEAERCDLHPLVEAVIRLLPDAPPGGGPFALQAADAIPRVLEEAGVDVHEIHEVSCPFHFNDAEELVAATIASTGPMHEQLRSLGERTHNALLEAAAPSLQADGSYRLENIIRVVTASPVPES